MIIVSDCLTNQPAEGCLKIANSLIKRIKKYEPTTTIISFGKTSPLADKHLKLNKLFLNWNLLSLIHRKKEAVLYIPNASCTMASAIRVWVMSRISMHPIKVLYVLWHGMNRITRFFLRTSGAQIICLSQESVERYEAAGLNAVCIKMGVDLEKFKPVNEEQRLVLREKYQIREHERVILHVGHLKEGRNLDKLCLLNQDFRIVVVVSSVTVVDEAVKKVLEKANNVRIIQHYIECIEEVYQLSDLYFFPVLAAENCIDIPLSVLEASACGIPVLTTPYGALKEFYDLPGFRFIKNFDAEELDDMICKLMSERSACENRENVKVYDWQNAVRILMEE